MPRRHPRPLAPRSAPRADPGRAIERERRAHEACAAKDRYESESEARATALMHVPGRGSRSVAYRCELCNGWHLTSRRA
jgi:hypothetical protein